MIESRTCTHNYTTTTLITTHIITPTTMSRLRVTKQMEAMIPTHTSLSKSSSEQENKPEVPRGSLAVATVQPSLPAKRSAGRPTKKTPERVARILDEVRKGMPQKTAATLAGISEDSLLNWKRDDPQFAALLESALADSEAALVARVQEAAAKDWRAAAFLLERRFSMDWGKRSAGEVQHQHLHAVAGQDMLAQLVAMRRARDERMHRAEVLTIDVEASPAAE